MVGICVLSSLPANDPLLNTFEFSDKIKHFIAYFVLGMSFCIWISPEKWRKSPLMHCLLVIALCTGFGIFDEYHQTFVPGRSGNDLGDIIVDFVGGAAAALAFFLHSRTWNT